MFATWLIRIWDMTRLNVSWRIYNVQHDSSVRDMTHSHVWHDHTSDLPCIASERVIFQKKNSWKCAKWKKKAFLMIPKTMVCFLPFCFGCVRHNLSRLDMSWTFARVVIWLVHVRDMTNLYVWYEHSHVLCGMTSSRKGHDSSNRVTWPFGTWLIHSCDMTVCLCSDMSPSCEGHASFIRLFIQGGEDS